MEIEENRELTKIRSILFPAIGIQIITGFSLYPKEYNTENNSQTSNIKISYMHEDLLEDKLHYIQIRKMLDKYCDQTKIQTIEHEVTNRFSSYRLEAGWRAEQYFLIDQTPVKLEEVDDLIRENMTIIGCSLQNELIVECEKDAMEYILEQFRLHANQYETHSETGNFVLNQKNEPVPNSHEIWDEAWEIPCILIHAQKVDKIKTYERVKKISFDMQDQIASLIVSNKWDIVHETDNPKLLIPSLNDYLILENFKPDDINNDFFINKIFFDWINEMDWERVAKTIELHGHIFKDLL